MYHSNMKEGEDGTAPAPPFGVARGQNWGLVQLVPQLRLAVGGECDGVSSSEG